MAKIRPLNKKTITMPTALADKWFKVLRSGRYHQAYKALENITEDYQGACIGYCCLGVMQKTISRKVEAQDGVSRNYPTRGWLESKNIIFHKARSGKTIHKMEEELDPVIGKIRNRYITASDANDIYDLSFNEIADLLEACVEKI